MRNAGKICFERSIPRRADGVRRECTREPEAGDTVARISDRSERARASQRPSPRFHDR